MGEASTIDHAEQARLERAIQRAEALVEQSTKIAAGAGVRERARRRRFRNVVEDDGLQQFTVEVADEVLRSPNSAYAAQRLVDVIAHADVSALGRVDRLLVALARHAAPLMPGPVVRVLRRRLRWETAAVVLDARRRPLHRHLRQRAAAGFTSNINVLGEAILSDAEAERRLEMILDRLSDPTINYVSVKLSAISARVNVADFDATVDALARPLSRLYRAAMGHGRSSAMKFVNLDMEEYRDLHLTVAVFTRLLDQPEFRSLYAGIVLQAYLPDSHDVARQLSEWACRRVADGGAPIKIRLVKGANLAMEAVDSELHGWPAAPYPDKASVDASYKRLLDSLLDERFDAAVRVGVASHNLLDLSWAIGLDQDIRAAGRVPRLDIEMLEGMANAQADAVLAQVRQAGAGAVVLYTPVVTDDDFSAAIAYLVRRLDENAAPGNFLSTVFDLRVGSPRWNEEVTKFVTAVGERHHVSTEPRRHQDRTVAEPPDDLESPFVNEADTDFTNAVNRSWIADHLAAWVATVERPIPDVAAVDDAVERLRRSAWGSLPMEHRATLINRVGDELAARRGELLATMAHTASKTILEGDPEVSEAVDFARFYARQARRLDEFGAGHGPLGVVVVAPPWNFPVAIPVGGVLAALAAGNTVVLKPAPQARACANVLVEACRAAGIDDDALAYVPCDDDDAGRRLITHPDVAAVILTGAYDTAEMFLGWRPQLRLHAETSGKNALVISASADVDLAIKDLVRSAFGHAGQKCSAASLAIVDASLYDAPAFAERLRDAVLTLQTGPATDIGSDLSSVVDQPSARLRRALTILEPGERWLVEPRLIDGDRRWTPGVRWNVTAGSWFARTECFGPVLGVIRASTLDEAIAIQNSVDYGLTAGLHTLDEREVEVWIEGVQAGNLYVNRGTTGAIVQRQPFGGWKRSAVGPTVKAGGPLYVASLCQWSDDLTVTADEAADGYVRWAAEHLGRSIDVSALRCERNDYRILPLRRVAVRLGPTATDRQRALCRAAAAASGVDVVWSVAADEDATDFAGRVGSSEAQRVRVIGDDDGLAAVVAAAAAAGLAVDANPPVAAPWIELPRWAREQSVTVTMHRHGRLLDRPSSPGTGAGGRAST